MKKYISKKDEWFDEGTEVELIDDYRMSKSVLSRCNAGLFRGTKNGKIDEEVCEFDEFDVIEE